jgi:hypothetical protein
LILVKASADRGKHREAAGAFAQGLIAVPLSEWCRGDGHTTMQQIQLGMFFAAMAALVVTGCIVTRKPTKKPPRETLRTAVPDEYQPGCFALEEERGGNWKGSGGTVTSIKEAKPSL